MVKMVDAQAQLRPDRSRSATIESILEHAELERRVREYYGHADAEREADDAFWDEAQRVSAMLDAADSAPKKKRARR